MKWRIKLLSFFYLASIGIILPFLPLLFQSRGLTNGQIGMLMAIGPLVSMLVQSPWGYLSDRLRTVKKVVMFQIMMAFLLSFLLFSLDSFYLLLPAAFLFFAFAWPPLPLIDCLTLAIAREKGGSFGSYRLWGSLGFAVTALVAGSVLAVVGIERVDRIYQGLLLLALLFAALAQDAPQAAQPVGFDQLKKLVTRKEVLLFLLLIALLNTTNKVNDAFMGIFMRGIGGSEADVGLAWTIGPLSEVPVFAFSFLFLVRFNELTLLALAAAIYSLRWFLFSITTDPALVTAIQVMHGLSFGLFYVSAVSYIGKIVPQHLRASGQGLLSTFSGGVAGIMGSLLGGYIMDGFGARFLYTSCSILALASVVAFLVLSQNQARKTAQVGDSP
ncbi:MAG TPA: MFS transporter [Desulfotomaculum sp.]|nr:MAG: hypothetical protein JL56_09180 [Desulfotomaculum sp. BICA1-6]HBX24305.1 MFS transporter [Desulfotomaculum sp.]